MKVIDWVLEKIEDVYIKHVNDSIDKTEKSYSQGSPAVESLVEEEIARLKKDSDVQFVGAIRTKAVYGYNPLRIRDSCNPSIDPEVEWANCANCNGEEISIKSVPVTYERKREGKLGGEKRLDFETKQEILVYFCRDCGAFSKEPSELAPNIRFGYWIKGRLG